MVGKCGRRALNCVFGCEGESWIQPQKASEGDRDLTDADTPVRALSVPTPQHHLNLTPFTNPELPSQITIQRNQQHPLIRLRVESKRHARKSYGHICAGPLRAFQSSSNCRSEMHDRYEMITRQKGVHPNRLAHKVENDSFHIAFG